MTSSIDDDREFARRMRAKPSVMTIQRLALRHALRADDHTVTANDIRDAALARHDDADHHDVGAALVGLRMSGVLTSLGYGPPSTSPRPQGNRVRVWQIADRDRAAALLAALTRQARRQGR